MLSDHKVAWLNYDDIAGQADRLLAFAGLSLNDNTFDVVDFLYHVVLPALAKVGKVYQVKVFDEPTRIPEESAWVDPISKTVNLASWVLREARDGEPFARLIVAHEIGHMVLHKDQGMAFSDANACDSSYLLDEESGEWQAHTFALCLLFPDALVKKLGHLDEFTLELIVSVPHEYIKQRRNDIEIREKITLRQFTGDQCAECHNFAMIRTGTSLKCDTCGTTMGCG